MITDVAVSDDIEGEVSANKSIVMSLYIKSREGMLNNNTSCYSYSIVPVITIYSDITRSPCTSCWSI